MQGRRQRWRLGWSEVKTDDPTQAPRQCESETFWGEPSELPVWSEQCGGVPSVGFYGGWGAGMRIPTREP